MIEVEQIGAGSPMEFAVTVRDAGGESRHVVTMANEVFQRLAGGGSSSAAVIEAAFRFLLDREPKEAILQRFDVTVISRYFPEFERELPRYLRSRDPKR